MKDLTIAPEDRPGAFADMGGPWAGCGSPRPGAGNRAVDVAKPLP